ncbi:hypothetical protein [Streptomyces sp. NPDC088358]|uniref:hypothetical protein n=1 Tax=Streptomyces sp. NPDC088358 TaxID=3365857 RepID=UPI0038127589
MVATAGAGDTGATGVDIGVGVGVGVGAGAGDDAGAACAASAGSAGAGRRNRVRRAYDAETGADFGIPSLGNGGLQRNAGGGGRDLEVDLVDRDLQQRLVGLDAFAACFSQRVTVRPR